MISSRFNLFCMALGLSTGAAILPTTAAIVTVDTEATIRSNDPATDQDEAGADYIMVKNHPTTSARKGYFQFDLTGENADLTQSATFSVFLAQARAHAINVWALDQAYASFTSGIDWSNAQANDTISNEMLTVGALTATQIGTTIVVPGTDVGDEVEVTLDSLAPFVFDNTITFVITGVDDAGNNSGGLRIARSVSETPAQLEFSVVPEPSSLALLGLGGLALMRRRRA